MSILDEIIEEQNAAPCAVSLVLDQLGEDRLELIEVLKDRAKFKTVAIMRVLDKHGHHVSRDRIGRCRRDCRCGLLKEKS